MALTIGVVGGLGPWATLYFFEQILRLTPAVRDQDHLRVIIDNNPAIPDRGPAILGRGEDPTPALVATAQNVERAGADLIAIPCNTAHAFYDSIRAAVGVPVLHIMEEVAAAVRAMEGVRRAGLLATRATVASRLYAEALAAAGVQTMVPPSEDQEVIDRLIYAIKAQDVTASLSEEGRGVASRLTVAGAQAIILGCTELPLAIASAELSVPLVDSTRVLASAAVRKARSEAAGKREAVAGKMLASQRPLE